MYFWYFLQFFILTLKISQAKIVNIYFSTRNLYIYTRLYPLKIKFLLLILIQYFQFTFNFVILAVFCNTDMMFSVHLKQNW